MADRRFSFDALRVRFRILIILAGLVFGAIFLRLAFLQVVHGARYAKEAEENRIRPEILRAHRGRLLDRQGRVLADNAPCFSLSFDPRDRAFRRNRPLLESVVTELAELLGRDATRMLLDVDHARRSALPPVTLSRSLDFATLSSIEERLDRLPGVEIRPEPARRYPHGTLAAHLIGYLGEVSESELGGEKGGRPYRGGDLVGRSGVEKEYEEHLRGEDGIEHVQVDALGRRTDLFDELPATPSVPGGDLILTIDLDIQRAAEAALDSVPSLLAREFGEEVAPRPGCVIAMDPRNGEILAMASRPAFDPNLFIQGLTGEDWRALSGEGFPLLNRTIQAAYPPGSTFKMVTALAGLHEGVLTPFSPMASACRGGLPFGNRVFRCHRKEGHGSLLLRDAVAKSCDVFFYQVGIRLGVERLTRCAVACSLGVATRVDLPQERAGLVPTIDWYKKARGGPPGGGAALNLSIGQGELLITPVALVCAVAAIANGGRIVRPHVALSLVTPDGDLVGGSTSTSLRNKEARTPGDGALSGTKPGESPEGRLPATDGEIAIVRDAMEAVVMGEGGTGRRAQVEPFRIGGKTGTAQNPHGEDHALFVCFAPVEEPEIAVVVVLEESGHGGAVAAPTARYVLDAYLNPGAKPLVHAGGMSPESHLKP